MKVLKFGGTSVANAQNILLVEKIIAQQASKHKLAVVVSAFSGVTDGLIQAAKEASEQNQNYNDSLKKIENQHLDAVKNLLPITQQSSCLSLVKKTFNQIEDICNGIYSLGEFTLKTQDKISAFGEYLSSKIIAERLNSNGLNCLWADSRLCLKTNSNFGQAEINQHETQWLLNAYFKQHQAQITLWPGFIASDEQGHTTTLGRGGSDYTAAIIAAAIHAQDLEIWTDVSGMMTADPRLVQSAKSIPQISYQEAMELSHFGAKVLYPPTIQPVMNQQMDLWIKNTFAPLDQGTLISAKHQAKSNQFAVGLSKLSQMALITMEGSGMVGVPGISAKLFGCLSSAKINVVLITQSSSEHSISIAIHENDVEKAKAAIETAFEDALHFKKINPIKVEKSMAIVAVVGEGMKNRCGVSAQLFGALGHNAINVRAMAQGSSERNISVVLSEQDVKKALNVLHEAFFESEIKQVHVYICGLGNVGSKLIQQIAQQNAYLNQSLLINLRIAGISNSSRMAFNNQGICPNTYTDALAHGQEASPEAFQQEIIQRNLRNSVFVDITANAQVANIYNALLQKSISVVACNKIAAASAYQDYQKLKENAKNHQCSFLFETNVGAGLPVIGSINDLVRSGDKITAIQAVLSGTLNFVFNNYDGQKTFAQVVKQAQDEGYTEPDPRLDLAGTDVARKILILAREAGYPVEFDEIQNTAFLPQACMQGSVDDFYKSLLEHEEHFKQLFLDAKNQGKILKYVASFKNGQAQIGLQHISPDSDLYHLYGKDNIVILNSLRYHDQPLVIKGAGAGADVTASGVFADIVRSV